jgi:hypothetical protein
MATAALTFNLEDVYDRNAHARAIKATDVYLVLLDLDNHLRSIYKYGDDEARSEFADEVRTELFKFMEDRGVTFGDLD